jgi:hypothetical protein
MDKYIHSIVCHLATSRWIRGVRARESTSPPRLLTRAKVVAQQPGEFTVEQAWRVLADIE